MVFRNAKTNILAITLQLLKNLNVRVNQSTVQHKLESHPDYPSLLAISDCLTDFNVDHITYFAQQEQFTETGTDEQMITFCPKNGGTFYLLDKYANGTVKLSNNQEQIKIANSDFINSCGGIVLAATADENSAEPDYQHNYIQHLTQAAVVPLFVATISAVIIYLFQINPFSWTILALTLLKLAGSLISLELLSNKLGYSNPFVNQICLLVKNNSCNNLLHARAAQPLSWLSWAEIGFAYFAGSFLVILLAPHLAALLLWLNILALPFTVYSISYQYQHKTWCLLCCAIQAILLLEFIVFMFQPAAGALHILLSYELLIPLMLCFLFPLSIWAVLKPVFKKLSFLLPIQQQLKQFKAQPELFKFALTNQEYHFINEDLMPVLLGKRRARTVVTLISNPFCEPCNTAHLLLDEWMQHNEDLRLRLIFVNENKENDPQTQVAQHMIALGLLEDSHKVQLALNDWYRQKKKDYSSWAQKYPVLIINSAKAACAKQKEWCLKAGIYYTPTILVNGYAIPQPYQFDDLKYLLKQDKQ